MSPKIISSYEPDAEADDGADFPIDIDPEQKGFLTPIDPVEINL